MKTTLAILALCAMSLVGCSDGDRFNGLVLTDTNTGKRYLLKHNGGDTYFVDEEITIISGSDTTKGFR